MSQLFRRESITKHHVVPCTRNKIYTRAQKYWPKNIYFVLQQALTEFCFAENDSVRERRYCVCTCVLHVQIRRGLEVGILCGDANSANLWVDLYIRGEAGEK